MKPANESETDCISPGIEPHRIAICITELDVGGAERFSVELATRLNRAVFRPAVYCLAPRPLGPGESLVARLASADVPVHFFGARGIGDAWRVLGQLSDEFRRQRPALVQTFLWHANVLGPLAARKLVGDQNRACRVPIVTGLRVAEPRRFWRRSIEHWTARLADRHIAVSDGVARFARSRIGLAAKKIVVISSGVDVDQFPAPPIDPRLLGVRAGRRFLVFVGRLDSDDQKGAAQLLEHARSLLDRLEEYDLVFVGDGPSAESLRQRTAELELQDRVHWLGWRGDVSAILAAADMLIAPSRWEGMSNAVLEAMASGKAVVAYDAEGIADLLHGKSEHGKSQHGGSQKERPSQIVAAGDWLGFVDRIVAVVGNAALRSRLGAINRQRVESCFRLEHVVARYERLYWELIEASRSCPNTNS